MGYSGYYYLILSTNKRPVSTSISNKPPTYEEVLKQDEKTLPTYEQAMQFDEIGTDAFEFFKKNKCY